MACDKGEGSLSEPVHCSDWSGWAGKGEVTVRVPPETFITEMSGQVPIDTRFVSPWRDGAKDRGVEEIKELGGLCADWNLLTDDD